MLKTGIALICAAFFLLAWEVIALWRSDDDIEPITAVVRALPLYGVAMLCFIAGTLFGHFFWCV